ncbi:MAG TPA: 2,3-bisphosphoglycerate-independent phosphoglycerate mutase [Vicinamibacterales bacterium]
MPHPNTPLALIILDGWGLRADRDHNAVALANPTTFLDLLARYRNGTLDASGEAVGLPAGQMGNSEVGHTNIGAGRIVYQDLTRIDKSIRDGDFFERPVLLEAFDRCKEGGRALHLLGLLSDGGVHSHQRHLHALLELAQRRGVPKVFVHVLTDGRDTSPTGGRGYLAELEEVMRRTGVGRVASISGRYYAMDRDKRWERTSLAYDAIVRGQGPEATTAASVIEESYAKGVTDEFILPHVITDGSGAPVGPVKAGDSVVFFNFRADRMRQIIRAIGFEAFDAFERGPYQAVHVATMTEYDPTYTFPIVFPPEPATGYIAEVLAEHGLTNLRLAETEKYAHVTYFLNGGREEPFPGEDRVLVPSPKVATYDLQPSMSAEGVADAFIDSVSNRKHDVIICNFANPDMVGHTGSLEAAVAAIKTVDGCLARIIPALLEAGGTALVTADHGNAEQMWDYELNAPHTAHTTNLVPVILVQGPGTTAPAPLPHGALCDLAPTMLKLLGLPPSKEMTGKSLV